MTSDMPTALITQIYTHRGALSWQDRTKMHWSSHMKCWNLHFITHNRTFYLFYFFLIKWFISSCVYRPNCKQTFLLFWKKLDTTLLFGWKTFHSFKGKQMRCASLFMRTQSTKTSDWLILVLAEVNAEVCMFDLLQIFKGPVWRFSSI